MELNAEVGLVVVHDTLITAIIGIDEELFPVGRQAAGVDLETMVL